MASAGTLRVTGGSEAIHLAEDMISIEAPKYRLMILAAVSFIASWLIFWPTVKVALKKKIVDNPEARKLQKIPIPVLGGVVVFFGVVVGLMFFKTMIYQTTLLPVLGAMVFMLYIGTIDDLVNIKPWKRLVLEMIVALLLVYGNRMCITQFQGLWGIGSLPVAVGVPLTVLMFVGVVNAVNMVDGIDGLLSGFGLLICGSLGLLCFLAHDYSNAALAAVTCGALVPFFLHNVFGKNTKMFLGDGGSMLLGTIICTLVIAILCGKFRLFEFQPWESMSLIAFALAVVSIPVADTLRVMFYRILHHRSPFQPDNNHLHHILLQLGLSHIAITLIELLLNVLVIAAMLLSWRLGASVAVQLYVVIAGAALLNLGTAAFLKSQNRRQTAFYSALCRIAAATRTDRSGLRLKLQKLIDGKNELVETDES